MHGRTALPLSVIPCTLHTHNAIPCVLQHQAMKQHNEVWQDSPSPQCDTLHAHNSIPCVLQHQAMKQHNETWQDSPPV